jgi:hypothetical protein
MQQANYINGFPRRMGIALSARIDREGFDQKRFNVIHAVQSDVQSIPLDLDGEQLKAAILNAADRASRECYRYVERYKLTGMIVDGIMLLCQRMRVPFPAGETSREIIARAVDRSWWVRRLRVEHARRFEHVSIQLGFTSMWQDPYISRESALRQAAHNRAIQKLLESITLTNGQDEYTVAALAELGPANKAIRRGELMLRTRGYEEIANDMGHVAMFWTITCPSKFHSQGGTNRKYNGATPRDAQSYLVKAWARMRSAMKREGIQPYGFRIAEPHSDGCPHWHMLLFVDPAKSARMEAIITKYALEEDGEEKGARENRVKLVRIDRECGTAAGYITKYISKNIDGYGVGDHKTFENGRTYILAPDVFGQVEITPSQRVTYWSQVWGIRQFQQIGGAPVGVWREMRRVKAETVYNAPAPIKAAWLACQKIESDDPMVAKQADYAEYVRAQGGPMVGRGAAIRMATRETRIEGRYAAYNADKPAGVYLASNPHAVYESVRYQWTVKDTSERRGARPAGNARPAGVAFGVPWTGVNNCTEFDYQGIEEKLTRATEAAAKAVTGREFKAPVWVDWPGIVREAREIERESKKFATRGGRYE